MIGWVCWGTIYGALDRLASLAKIRSDVDGYSKCSLYTVSTSNRIWRDLILSLYERLSIPMD